MRHPITRIDNHYGDIINLKVVPVQYFQIRAGEVERNLHVGHVDAGVGLDRVANRK